MSSASQPSAFLKNVLQNGVGRYVCQMQRVTLNFCKSRADSRGMRDFIESYMLDFTRNNPGIVVYLKPRRHRAPCINAEYLNGQNQIIYTTNQKSDEICKWLEHLRTRSGVDIVRLRKKQHTDNPSIQGVWHPFLNKDTSISQKSFPSEELSKFLPKEATATEKLLEKARQLRVADNKIESLQSPKFS